MPTAKDLEAIETYMRTLRDGQGGYSAGAVRALVGEIVRLYADLSAFTVALRTGAGKFAVRGNVPPERREAVAKIFVAIADDITEITRPRRGL